MVDLKSSRDTTSLREEDLRQGIELMFYAYRDFTGEPDAILEEYALGRAHHRVIYFVGRNPGISITELLDILRITKQSLARVLGKLIADGFINQRLDPSDRRRKQLTLSAKGKELEHALTSTQMERFVRAYCEAGEEAVVGFRRVLTGIINPEDRARVRPVTRRRS
ncbi:MAG: MarR family transcriptional regulator [Rhodospirillaceae bacterium]|nr:MarR family transcriptional regulator [Rhodospirillaceae bacterium]